MAKTPSVPSDISPEQNPNVRFTIPKNLNVFDRLRFLFGIAIDKPTIKSKNKLVHPGKRTDKGVERIDFPSDLQKLWEWWLHETNDTADTLKNRIDRYKDLDFMYYNSTVISMAIEMYADETVQSDDQSQCLQVFAKDKKVENYIEEFFDKLGITQKVLRNTAFDLALYGDHFWIHPSDDEQGIYQCIPLDVYSVKDRFEFNPATTEAHMRQVSAMIISQLVARDARIKALSDTILKKEHGDMAAYFTKYLFGFQVEETIYVPPWNMSHFRRFSTKSEFSPFGRPLLINAISTFRQLQSSRNLIAMARVAKFPRERYQIQTDETMTPTERWMQVNESREEYLNLGVQQTGREEFGVGGAIFLPKDLVEFDLIEPNINIDDISDVEMLRDDIILATRIPKGYLIVDKASFGTSGQSLLQQFKPFGRSVYSLQTTILDELTQLVRLQFAMTGEYDYNEDFELTMSFPVIEESQDRLRQKGDTFHLAMDIINSISDALGINKENGLPPSVIKSALAKLSFLDREQIDVWVDEIEAQKAKEKTNFDSQQESVKRKIMESVESRLSEEIIREAYFMNKKKRGIREGVHEKRHFYSSFNIDPSQKIILEFMDNFNSSQKSKKDSGTLEG